MSRFPFDRRRAARRPLHSILVLTVLASTPLPGGAALAQGGAPVRTGAAAFGDWRSDAPGVWRRITVQDLPAPFATPSTANTSRVVERPAGAALKVPAGFVIKPFASNLDGARIMRRAPNGDIFLSQGVTGKITVLRAAPGADRPSKISTFADNLDQPYGMAFYPADHPRWLYVAETDAVVRFPYVDGDLKARGAPQTVVARLTDGEGGHWTRDLAFSPDSRRMFVSVGSASNVAEEMGKKSVADAKAFDAGHGAGAAWGPETDRADVLAFTPEGGPAKVYAGGIRNCSGLAVQPGTGVLWCATNERDGLGDNLVPDYVTRVKPGGFYGWPWLYLGAHEDPRRKGERPDLAGAVTVPDVLIQPHSAPLALAFYPSDAKGAAAFPAEYAGDAFVTLHGSWNRSLHTGYKLVRVKLGAGGAPTGVYEDFLTGFAVNPKAVWGRPTGVVVMADGALLMSEDGNGTLWRIAYTRPPAAPSRP